MSNHFIRSTAPRMQDEDVDIPHFMKGHEEQMTNDSWVQWQTLTDIITDIIMTTFCLEARKTR